MSETHGITVAMVGRELMRMGYRDDEAEDDATVCLGLVMEDARCDHCHAPIGAARVVVVDPDRFGVVWCVPCVLSDVTLIRDWVGVSDEH